MAWLKQTLAAVPQLALLISKLMGDKRIPTETKLALAGLPSAWRRPLT